MRSAWIFLLAPTLIGCKERAWTPISSADLVLTQIRFGGGAAISRRIDNDSKFAETVINGIATGDSSWLDVARALPLGSSAAEASMVIALASALPKSPDGVLRLLGRKYPVDQVCSIPFLEADSATIAGYRDETILALGRIPTSPITARRDRCVAALERSSDEKLARIDPHYIIKNKPTPLPKKRRRR